MGKTTITKGLAGLEDLQTGNSTYQQTRRGQVGTYTQIGGTTLPMEESGGTSIKDYVDSKAGGAGTGKKYTYTSVAGQTDFALDALVNPNASVFYNGVMLFEGLSEDYTVSGNKVILNKAVEYNTDTVSITNLVPLSGASFISHELELTNNLEKKLTFKVTDRLLVDKDVTYVDSVDDLSSIVGSDGDVVNVTDKDRGGVFVYDSLSSSFIRQKIVLASTTKLWELTIDDAGVLTTSEIV